MRHGWPIAPTQMVVSCVLAILDGQEMVLYAKVKNVVCVVFVEASLKL